MATVEEIRARWEARREEGQRLGAMVPLATIATEVLTELREMCHADEDVLSIQEAALSSGYSQDHLRREIALGHIKNAGRKGKPAMRRGDVPRKPGHSVPLPMAHRTDQISARRRIVLDATTTPPERRGA